MNSLNFSNNITRLRHEKNITQEQLAEFVGVTKASVSKWETGQSLPDVLLLPRLAAFFDVTIDMLLGYEPQLSKEQIQKIYRDLAAAFAKLPFEAAMEKSQIFIKKYYSCYPFLFQVCSLWLNHFMLAAGRDRQIEGLTAISELCSHIISGCRDIGICEDTAILKASVDLQLGRAEEAIEALEEILNPYRFSTQSDSVLIQAYMLAGKEDEADRFAQMSMFLHLLNLTASATHYIIVHSNNLSICEETILRIENVAAAYQLERLHPNAMGGFCYQAAIVYGIHNKKRKALKMLKRYVDAVDYLLTGENLTLHGDDYFNRISGWYEQLDIGSDAPRDKRLILEDAIQALQHSAFAGLEKDEEYQNIKNILIRREEYIYE